MPGVSPASVPNIIVACDDAVLIDEIVRHLEEIPHWRLLGSARSVEELQKSLEMRPDAVLLSSGLAKDLATRDIKISARTIVFGREDDKATLRASLNLEAKGFVLWPSDRDAIRSLVERGLSKAAPARRATGNLTSVWSPKGGTGVSVISAHLAAALAGLGVNTLLVDLDLDHADQSALLGAEREKKNILDLMRVIEEATPAIVESIAWKHPEGFSAILAPGAAGESELVKASELSRALTTLKESAEQIVVDVPSGFSELLFAVVQESSRVLLVVTPDLLSLRRAKAARRALESSGVEATRLEVVMNQVGGREISANDVSAVLGVEVVAEIRADLSILSSADRGELSARGRVLVDPLARRVAGLPQPSPRRWRGR